MEPSLLKIYSRLLFPNIKLFGIFTSTRTFAAKPVVKGRGSTALPTDQEESYVEEDAEKLCKYVNINYKNEGLFFKVFSLIFWLRFLERNFGSC